MLAASASCPRAVADAHPTLPTLTQPPASLRDRVRAWVGGVQVLRLRLRVWGTSCGQETGSGWQTAAPGPTLSAGGSLCLSLSDCQTPPAWRHGLSTTRKGPAAHPASGSHPGPSRLGRTPGSLRRSRPAGHTVGRALAALSPGPRVKGGGQGLGAEGTHVLLEVAQTPPVPPPSRPHPGPRLHLGETHCSQPPPGSRDGGGTNSSQRAL